MKKASPALMAAIDALRVNRDSQALIADCFTFTLSNGLILTTTNADVPVTLNGYVYRADSILVDGLHYKAVTGLEVDQQRITLAARPTDTIGGIPILSALRNGLFDGCRIKRERAFLAAWGTAPIGSVILFVGRVATIDQLGRSTAEITVNSELALLDVQMPRNLYQPHCNHVLYDAGCGLARNAFRADGSVESGSTPFVIQWSASEPAYEQGLVTFTSGVNNGVTATVKWANTAQFGLAYPLDRPPSIGDTFTIYQGCDHTFASCGAKFSNQANFRGFPYVPAPVSAY
ncbi:DUF2163 domain-containing protein [Beijerinckia indica]|uniref:Bacteriophage phiJL001 Gp84 C-terminal domain-containing protein n=1 Tax=Beijerinckia indica subsp. indica (strain ATCC 9039 / DSM 1715 / NCIMB 8712) TaxID=395963 RepID=B2IJD6_BEII9|nr:DUF2163 domain-containing protein [Beijerinckia indica]ACB96298.1 conserved hypothetical protein [Beijerinckia indica subsp. indica ATCC 9039]